MNRLNAIIQRRKVYPIINIHCFMDHHLWWRIQIIWLKKCGHFIDKNDPKDINEKKWLICFGDTIPLSELVDKIKVHKFIKAKGSSELLSNIYGT